MPFHRRCGDRIALLNSNHTAVRNYIESSQGVVISDEPLEDDVAFEVSIDKMVNGGEGNLEIGVAESRDANEFSLVSAVDAALLNAAWVLSGRTVMKNGVVLTHDYGTDLNSLVEGDIVGVVRSNKGELLFLVNGRCMGVAAAGLPPLLNAVVHLRGRCLQVTADPPSRLPPPADTDSVADQMADDQTNNGNSGTVSTELETAGGEDSPQFKDPEDDVRVDLGIDVNNDVIVPQDLLRFHPRCGVHVSLSNENRTAERTCPLEDYNNGVVVTHRPLQDNELLEVRIERLIEKWSGSIELGLTTHSPTEMVFPNTMTNLSCGTIIMSGSKILINGHSTGVEYGHSNLDDLREGDRVGVMRSSAGKMHVFINGVNQGVACEKVRQPVWGVVDLYGMAVKVSIVKSSEIDITQSGALSDVNIGRALAANRPRIDDDTLLFHTLRDSDVVVINDGKTAHRPNAHEFFHNGVVMTNRTLKTNELFQVRLDAVIAKWAGSIEIGVTQHLCNEIIFPFKMSSAKSGTWAMTGEDVVRDGSVIIPQYVRDLSRLVEGDTVGVVRKDMGVLHFYVNGVDQGVAAFNVPEHVFGVVDLYGKVAEVTIVDEHILLPISSLEHSLASQASSESNGTIYPEMCFHRSHGRNVQLKHSHLTAKRVNVYSEFSDATLCSSRPLRECEMFEIRIDKLVDCWTGSLEIGVTALRPEELMRGAGEVRFQTHLLSGSSVLRNGEPVLTGYPLDLDKLSHGSRVGLMWHSDRSLHYYLDGLDQGRAFDVPHLSIYAVVELDGRCTQVSIVQGEERGSNYACQSDNSMVANVKNYDVVPLNRFSEYHGEQVLLGKDDCVAERRAQTVGDALVFSCGHLRLGEPFQMQIVRCGSPYSGSLRVGLTDVDILNAHVNRSLPANMTLLPHFTTYVDGDKVMRSVSNEKEHICVGILARSLDHLGVGDTLALVKMDRSTVHLTLNNQPLELAFTDVPDKVFVAAELYGSCTTVKVHSTIAKVAEQPIYFRDVEAQQQQDSKLQSSSRTAVAGSSDDAGSLKSRPFTFHRPCGSNVRLLSSDTVAMRPHSYNHGIAVVSYPLQRGQTCNIRIDKVDGRWSGGVMVGAVAKLPEKREELPDTAMQLHADCWVVDHEYVNCCGQLVSSDMGRPLKTVAAHVVIGVSFTRRSTLELLVDGVSCGTFARVPGEIDCVYPLVDLYGSCTQVSILMHSLSMARASSTMNLTEEIDNRYSAIRFTEDAQCAERCGDDKFRDDVDGLITTLGKNMDDEEVRSGDELYCLADDDSRMSVDDEQDCLVFDEISSSLFSRKVRRGTNVYNIQVSDDSLSEDAGVVDYDASDDASDAEEFSFQKKRDADETSDSADLVDEIADDDEHVPRARRDGSLDSDDLSQNQSIYSQDAALSASVDTSCSRAKASKERERDVEDEGDKGVAVEDEDEPSYGGLSVTPDHRDHNVRHNALYPEQNENDSDARSDATYDFEQHRYEDEDLSDEDWSGAVVGDRLEARQTRDLDEQLSDDQATLDNVIWYINSLLSKMDEGEGAGDVEYSGGCANLRTALMYWSYIVPHFPGRRHMVWGQVTCHCNECDPASPDAVKDWVHFRRPVTPDPRYVHRRYLNVEGHTLRWVLLNGSQAQNAPRQPTERRRPVLECNVPAKPEQSNVWYDDERNLWQACVLIEIETTVCDASGQRYRSPVSDQLDDTGEDRIVGLLMRVRQIRRAGDEDDAEPTSPCQHRREGGDSCLYW